MLHRVPAAILYNLTRDLAATMHGTSCHTPKRRTSVTQAFL
jgi:hypothetical protein